MFLNTIYYKNNVINKQKKTMSAVNNKFRCYGYKEETAFQGLEPKLMEQLGEEFVIGKVDEPVISMFDPTAPGYDSMNVVNTKELADQE